MEKDTKPKAKGWLQKIGGAIKWTLGNGRKASDSGKKEADGEDYEKEPGISDLLKGGDWVLSENLSIIPHFGEIGEVFEKRGFFDGAKGIDGRPYYNLAKTKVRSLVDDLRALFDAQRYRLKTTVIGLETIARNRAEIYEQTDRVIQRKRSHPREYSLLLAGIYMFVAVVLVLADIPLAVKLIEKGFDLDLGEPGISEFMRQPWEVIKGNWEPIIMALGIAFCSIFLKILYDEYVSGPLSNRATMFRRELDLDQKSEEEKKSVEKAWRFRIYVKLAILVLTLGTIIVLGLFRFQGVSAEEDIPKYLVSSITQLTFILITLLFPIVSGVCFSMGLDRILNSAEFYTAKLVIGRHRKAFLKSKEAVVMDTAQLGKIQAYYEWVCSEAFFRKYLDFLLSCYVIGYERGKMSPESKMNEKGYFEMISRMRRKILARQVFNSAKAANQTDEESLQAIFERMIREDLTTIPPQIIQPNENSIND